MNEKDADKAAKRLISLFKKITQNEPNDLAFKNFVAILIFLLRIEKRDPALEFRRTFQNNQLTLEIGKVVDEIFVLNDETTSLVKELIEKISKEDEELVCQILKDNFTKSIPEYEQYLKKAVYGRH